MFLLTLTAFAVSRIQALFRIQDGMHQSIMMYVPDYRYNSSMYFFGLVIFCDMAVFLYKKLFAADFEKITDISIFQRFITWTVITIWGWIMSNAVNMGINHIIFRSDDISQVFMENIAVFGLPLITLIYLASRLISGKRSEGFH